MNRGNEVTREGGVRKEEGGVRKVRKGGEEDYCLSEWLNGHLKRRSGRRYCCWMKRMMVP